MIKTGIWQVIELFTIILSMYVAIRNNGKPLSTKKEADDFISLSFNFKLFAYAIGFTFVVLTGPVLAWLGGCHGIWLLAYDAVCFIYYLLGCGFMHSGSDKINHSIIRTTLTMALYTWLLYMGDFWVQ